MVTIVSYRDRPTPSAHTLKNGFELTVAEKEELAQRHANKVFM